MLVISFGVIVAISGDPMGSQSLQARAFADKLAFDLRFARMEAITHGKLVVVSISRTHRTIVVDDDRARPIPHNVSISNSSLISAESADETLLRFAPNGAATGGRIRVSVGRAVYIIDVNWLSGLVRLIHHE